MRAVGRNQTAVTARGLHLHATLAVSATGRSLGVLLAKLDAPKREPAATPKEKTYRWIEGLRDCAEVKRSLDGVRVISVVDREADFFALFAEQRATPEVELLVRAKQSRGLVLNGGRAPDEAPLFHLPRDGGTERIIGPMVPERCGRIVCRARVLRPTITCHYPFPGRSYCREEWFKTDSNPKGIDHCGEDADRPLLHGLTERLRPFTARKGQRHPFRPGGKNGGRSVTVKFLNRLY